MKTRTLLVLPFLALCAMSCSNQQEEKKYTVGFEATNALINTESSATLEIKENQYFMATCVAKEGYVLPSDIRVTSGNEALLNNKDYTYSLTNESTANFVVKVTKDLVINLHALEKESTGLFIGSHKIESSGDYSWIQYGTDEDAKTDMILYESETNTLTLNYTTLEEEVIGSTLVKGLPNLFDKSKTIDVSFLIAYTGNDPLNLIVNGENKLSSSSSGTKGSIYVHDGGAIKINGCGALICRNTNYAAILNNRGSSDIQNVEINIPNMITAGIISKTLTVIDSSVKIDVYNPEINIQNYLYGVYSYHLNTRNSNFYINNTYNAIQATFAYFYDTDIVVPYAAVGLALDWLFVRGTRVGDQSTTNIVIHAEIEAIDTYDSMDLNGAYIYAISNRNNTICTVDMSMYITNCYIYAQCLCVNDNKADALHAFKMVIEDSTIYASSVHGFGIRTSIHGAQRTGEVYEPVFAMRNSTIYAQGEICAMYGIGRAEIDEDQVISYENGSGDVKEGKYIKTSIVTEKRTFNVWSLFDVNHGEVEFVDPTAALPIPIDALTSVSITVAN